MKEFKSFFKTVTAAEGDRCKSNTAGHIPLEAKVAALEKITGFSQVSICEDVPEHYEFWRQHINPNKDDCCNLRKGL